MSLVTDSQGNPMATGMGWNINTPRPSDQQILDSSIGPVIASLQGALCVRPDDLGLTPEPGDDDTEVLQWALLVSRVLGVPLYINREVRYSTGVLEIQEGQTVYGNGPFRPGLRMDVKSIIESQSIATVNSYLPSLCHAPGVDKFTIRDLQIDGGQGDIDWAAIAESGQYAADLSNVLRNSPGYSGLGLVNQSGRNVPTEVVLEDIHIHDTCGTCMFGFPKIRGRNITLGNSVSGRVLYRFYGECLGLHTYGFTRSSIARVNAACLINHWTYEGMGHTNPWPENASQRNICAIERQSGVPGRAQLLNIYWDGTDSELFESFKANENCIVTGRIKSLKGPYTADVEIGPYSMDFDLVATDCTPPDLAAFEKANLRSANIRWVHKTESRDKATIDWSYTGPAYAVWSKNIDLPIRVSVARKAWHAADHEQRINIHFDHDWPQWLVLQLPDLTIDDGSGLRLRTPEEVVPTYIRLSGRIDNRMAAWIGPRGGVTEQYVPQLGELEALPIKVIFDGLACNEISPGSFRGDQPHTIHSEIWLDLARFPLYSNVGIP